MAAPVPFTMSGAISGAPISATPASASWFYVAIQAIAGQSAGLMTIANKSGSLMSMIGRSVGLMTIRPK
jgi:hypothetical protein